MAEAGTKLIRTPCSMVRAFRPTYANVWRAWRLWKRKLRSSSAIWLSRSISSVKPGGSSIAVSPALTALGVLLRWAEPRLLLG